MHCSRVVPVSVFLLAMSILIFTLTFRRLTTQGDYSYRGHDYPQRLPLSTKELASVLMISEESAQYPVTGYDSDKQWAALTRSDLGVVRVGPERRAFVLSMFHQMHCLRILNLAYSKAHIASVGHVQHCLNYLRQAALCSSDVTLEAGNFEERNFDIDRTGGTYVCKDWETVYRIFEEDDPLRKENTR